MTGVEGYVESAASGLIAGINAARKALGQDLVVFPDTSTLGSMAHYITTADSEHFQPMNANFGLLPKLEKKIRNKRKRTRRWPIGLWRRLPRLSRKPDWQPNIRKYRLGGL